MKSNNHNLDFEQLLSDVERAGRDARRREQLATMIDGLAGMPSDKPTATRHGFWWWSSRVAAAACVLFFVTTAVRIWFIPTESYEPLVAEVVTPPYPPQGGTESLALIDSTIAAPVRPVAPHRVVPHPNAVPTTEPTVEETPEPIEEVTLPLIEELIAEEIESQEVEPVEEAEESALETIVAPVVSVAYSEPQEQPQEQTRRRSLFRIHLTEPDIMEGNILALKLL